MRGKALVGVMSLVLALTAAMLFVGCADSSLREAMAAKDDSAIDWGGMTAADAREMIESGELDPNGLYVSAGKTVSAPPLAKVAVAGNGDLDVLNALAEHGADIDGYGTGGEVTLTALNLALFKGDIGIARRLLELGANPNLVDSVKRTPSIFYPLISSKLSLTLRKEMIDLLLAHGADINALDHIAEEYLVVTSPLMDVVLRQNSDKYPDDYRELIPYLISRGADINIRPLGGAFTPVGLAVFADDVDIVEELIKLGGNVNILADDNCWSPLITFALFGSDMEIFDLLLSRGANLDHKCPKGKDILNFIAERKNGESDSAYAGVIMRDVEWEEKFPTIEEWRAFGDVILARIAELCETEERAVCREDDGAIDWGGVTAASARELIEKGELDPNGLYARYARGEEKWIPLMLIVDRHRNNGLDVLNVLVEHGADIDKYATSHNLTALDIAVYRGKIDVARRLLELGANPNLTDSVRRTPSIHYALINPALNLGARKEMFDLLLTHGADIDAIDHRDEQLNVSLLMGMVVHFVFGKMSEGDKGLIPYLVSRGADINIRPRGDGTAMHFAAMGDDPGVVNELIRLGGDVNIISDSLCWTPLWAFAVGGQNMEIFDLLLSQGADLDHRCDGASILDFIALRKKGDLDSVFSIKDSALFIKHGLVLYSEEKFPTVGEWREFGDIILARIVELCETEERAVCQELGGETRGVASAEEGQK